MFVLFALFSVVVSLMLYIQPASVGVAVERGGGGPARRMCSMWVINTDAWRTEWLPKSALD